MHLAFPSWKMNVNTEMLRIDAQFSQRDKRFRSLLVLSSPLLPPETRFDHRKRHFPFRQIYHSHTFPFLCPSKTPNGLAMLLEREIQRLSHVIQRHSGFSNAVAPPKSALLKGLLSASRKPGGFQGVSGSNVPVDKMDPEMFVYGRAKECRLPRSLPTATANRSLKIAMCGN